MMIDGFYCTLNSKTPVTIVAFVHRYALGAVKLKIRYVHFARSVHRHHIRIWYKHFLKFVFVLFSQTEIKFCILLKTI